MIVHGSRRASASAVIAVLLGLFAAPAAAGQGPRATVTGTVELADGTLAAGAMVALLDRRGSVVAETTADASGRFRFESVAVGTYATVARAAQARSPAVDVAVESAHTVTIALRLTPRVDETVVVQGVTASPAATVRTTIGREAVQALPARLGTRALPQMLATMPGWSSEDNGLLHIRGVDDGVLYVEDGVPVYDRLDAVFGLAPSASAIASLNVVTGYIPAEHGLKAGAVVEVQSPPHADRWAAVGSTGGGSSDTATAQVTAGGPLTSRLGLGVGLVSERSGRFLDPVHPDNLHNTGYATAATVRAEAGLGAADTLRVTVHAGRSRFDVPHGEAQEDAGQDQRQRLTQQSQSTSWQRVWSDRIVTQAAAYRRRIDGTLDDTPAATPLYAQSRRSHDRRGLLASVAYDLGRHAVKAGGEMARLGLDEDFRFAVTDDDDDAELSEAAAAFTLARPFVFLGEATRWQGAFFLQDRVRLTDQLTLDAGLRFDRTRLLLQAAQWSPRIGLAHRWPGPSTTFRVAYNRFFQPPQPEHLLLSSSPDARALSPFVDDDEDESGGAALPPERQHAWELGVDQLVGGVARISAAAWRRDVRNYADPNVFFGTTIIFPNSVASGLARGLDLRVDVPGYRGWSSSLTYTLAKVEQTGPINGGLFLEDGIDEIGPGVSFTPDHDQRHAATALVSYTAPHRGVTLATSVRYESGTPLELDDDLDAAEAAELAERPGAALIDLDRGRVKPRLVVDASATARVLRLTRGELSLRASALNLLDRAYAFNFGNPFSGTHFGAPRQFRIDLQFSFE